MKLCCFIKLRKVCVRELVFPGPVFLGSVGTTLKPEKEKFPSANDYCQVAKCLRWFGSKTKYDIMHNFRRSQCMTNHGLVKGL